MLKDSFLAQVLAPKHDGLLPIPLVAAKYLQLLPLKEVRKWAGIEVRNAAGGKLNLELGEHRRADLVKEVGERDLEVLFGADVLGRAPRFASHEVEELGVQVASHPEHKHPPFFRVLFLDHADDLCRVDLPHGGLPIR